MGAETGAVNPARKTGISLALTLLASPITSGTCIFIPK